MKSYIGLLTALLSLTANAKTLILDPASAVTGSTAWYTAFEQKVTELKQQGIYPGEGYAECRETTEFKGVYLCLYPSLLEMNLAFGRASFYVEGDDGYPVGQIVPLDNPTLVIDNEKILGHDLKAPNLLSYIQAAHQACDQSKNDPKICLSAPEADLVNNFLFPQASKNPDFIVIAAPTQPSKEWQATITHELSHAQYFREPQFQQVVHDFWTNQVTDKDRAGILDVLAKGFDTNDKVLMENEFQAFILESGAYTSDLKEFAPIYRDRLIAALKAAGVTPIFSK